MRQLGAPQRSALVFVHGERCPGAPGRGEAVPGRTHHGLGRTGWQIVANALDRLVPGAWHQCRDRPGRMAAFEAAQQHSRVAACGAQACVAGRRPLALRDRGRQRRFRSGRRRRLPVRHRLSGDLVAGDSDRLARRYESGSRPCLPRRILHERRLPGGTLRACDAPLRSARPGAAADPCDGEHGVLALPAARGAHWMGNGCLVARGSPGRAGGSVYRCRRPAGGRCHGLPPDGDDCSVLGLALVGRMDRHRRLGIPAPTPGGRRCGAPCADAELRGARGGPALRSPSSSSAGSRCTSRTASSITPSRCGCSVRGANGTCGPPPGPLRSSSSP